MPWRAGGPPQVQTDLGDAAQICGQSMMSASRTRRPSGTAPTFQRSGGSLLVDVFTNASDRSRNGLLAALEPSDFALLHAHLGQLSLITGATLQEKEAPVEQIYFPLSRLVSLVAVMEAGEVVETATVSRLLGQSPGAPARIE